MHSENGVTVLKFAQSDAQDYDGIGLTYGGKEVLQRLLKEVHASGTCILLTVLIISFLLPLLKVVLSNDVIDTCFSDLPASSS